MKTNLTLALLVLSVAGCSGPLVYAEIEDQEICFVKPNQPVDSAPDLAPPGTEIPFEADLDLKDGIPGIDQGAVTGITQITGLQMDSATDMSGIDTGDFDISKVSDTVTSLQHISYTKANGATNVFSIPFTVDQPSANLLDPLAGGKGQLHFKAKFKGLPPTVTQVGGATWHVDITVCIYAKVKVDATKL